MNGLIRCPVAGCGFMYAPGDCCCIHRPTWSERAGRRLRGAWRVVQRFNAAVEDWFPDRRPTAGPPGRHSEDAAR